MRVVLFDPQQLADAAQKQWWAKWSQRAQEATTNVVAAWEEWLIDPKSATFKPAFNSQIWADLKQWFKDNVFHKKCAYCEVKLTGMYGDAEHFRPKGSVQCKQPPGTQSVLVEVDLPIEVRPGGPHRLPHPGYFWLAYEWRNLIPSCQVCNEGGGKVDQFPTAQPHLLMVKLQPSEAAQLKSPARASPNWPDLYYLAPEDLDDRERPLLLNPLNAGGDRDPHQHLVFGIKGTISSRAKSAAGETTIAVFHLDQEELRKMRQAQQEAIKQAYLKAFNFFDDPDEAKAKAEEAVATFHDGSEPFSAAALAYLHELKVKLGA